jgi:hypothetical protein
VAIGAAAGLVGFGGATGGVVFGEVVGMLLDRGYGYGLVFTLAGSFPRDRIRHPVRGDPDQCAGPVDIQDSLTLKGARLSQSAPRPTIKCESPNSCHRYPASRASR